MEDQRAGKLSSGADGKAGLDPAGELFIVRGYVRQSDGSNLAPLAGASVRAYDHDIGGTNALGQTSSRADGAYEIRYSAAQFRRSSSEVGGPDLIVRVYNQQGQLLSSSRRRNNAKPLETLDLTVKVDSLSQRIFQVQGRIASRVSAGVAGLRVRIVDKRVGDDLQLAETFTDEDGGYQASFSDAALQKPYKARPDLQARVFAGTSLIASSAILYNASTRETLNLLLDEQALPALRSEHETLTSALFAHFSGKLADLRELDDRQDITYLAKKTGWDARAVALAALADQFSARTGSADNGTGIEPAFFYALFRAGLPANEQTLYRVDSGMLATVWNKAAEQGVISKALIGSIPQVIEQFQGLSAQRLLSGPALLGASSFKEMLAVSRLSAAQQQQFAELYAVQRNDLPSFWQAVGATFGKSAADRLQIDGKLGFLTLNNAPLMQQLHKLSGQGELADLVELAQAGYYQAEDWSRVLTSSIPVPKEIPGDTLETKRANYAAYLAAQVRLSYPTAALAQQVKSGQIPIEAADQVHAFLSEHQGQFEIGAQPVAQYIARHKLNVPEQTVTQVKRLQRVYQLTTSDTAMASMLRHKLDAAYHVVRYDRQTFAETFAQDLDGLPSALQIFDRSLEIHNTVLNVTLSYLTAKHGIALGSSPLGPSAPEVSPGRQFLSPAPKGPSAAHAADVIAYPTLEGLFGELDFCACDHCRSILSPAAYLVDLLLFLDQPVPPKGKENPQHVLLERRPDLQHLPLTCENTNTALPYIDLVNETLEYFIANKLEKLSLEGYLGHDTGDADAQDLLASPQFVMDAAYTTLRGEYFPVSLPFHQPLEQLRRYFDPFGLPLALAMERLRKSNDLERGTNPYGWRDIWMEELGLARAEYDILTNAQSVPLWRMYGFRPRTTNTSVIAALSKARDFTRRLDISYEELNALLKTRFINPNSELIPKLERLGVSFATLSALKAGTLSNAAFEALLPSGTRALDPEEYDGDIKAWVKDDDNYARIMSIITLTDPAGDLDPCSFDKLELRYARPAASTSDTSTRLSQVELIRILRFIRLWKKLGWSIERTDAAICALYQADLAPIRAEHLDTVAKLDAGFLTLLPRLGMIVRALRTLGLTVARDLLPLLACWSDIGTHGESALYRQMFLNPALLEQDAVFSDNGYGAFLSDPSKRLIDHAEALRSAFNLTGDEYERIVSLLFPDPQNPLIFDLNTALTLPNISAIFRRCYLARTLRISVPELLLLILRTGLDPFAAPDPSSPALLKLIWLVQTLGERSLTPAAALSLIWNQDLGGTSAPAAAELAMVARTLRADLAGIETQLAESNQPDLDIDSMRRKRQQILQRLSAATTLDPAFTQLLLDPPMGSVEGYPLHAAGQHDQPIIQDMLALERPGLAARFYFRASASGAVDLSLPTAANLDYSAGGSNSLPANPTPAATISAIWSGRLEIPETAVYGFSIEADAGAQVRLELGGQARGLTRNGTIWRTTEPLELNAGTLYEVVLSVEKLKERLSVQWEAPKRPRETIPARYLYSSALLELFNAAYRRFLKIASLAMALDLTANELAYFASHADYQIAGDGWLNVLPVGAGQAGPSASALLAPFQELLDFARIKAELSPNDERLLALLKDPLAATIDANSLLYTLTRWDPSSLRALLSHFGVSSADLGQPGLFRRVYDAFALIQTTRSGAQALIAATTNDPTGVTVRDLQAALRARYAAASWREVVQPINDELRSLQRDALVSFILHQLRSDPDTSHIDTADKLFEHFLMDVQIEPCMQTSRIRHALSSVQLFTERCLMNLEPRVSPSSINARQWEWMKRYRVWEANRQILLFPENWLEPELRDDKSPFFKEIESELLQSDITEQTATTALLNYLAKLEEVAKLEPCGLHHIPADAAKRTGEIDHVIARTSGASRKYYYRRKEGGSWTAWEQIKLDIEDNPVLPVVWNDRLFLFWLRILKQSPLSPQSTRTSSNTSDSLASLSLSEVQNDAKANAQTNTKINVQAILCWSEHFNGKWQALRTSDINRPLDLGRFEAADLQTFRSTLKLAVLFWTRGSARIIVSSETGFGASFFLHNASSAPELREGKKERHLPAKRILGTSTNALKISYPAADLAHAVLRTSIRARTVEPRHPLEGSPWDAPFFYEDSRHVFYVTTAEQPVKVARWNDYGVVERPPRLELDIPPLILNQVELIPDPLEPLTKQPGFGIFDPSPIERYLTEDAFIQRGIASAGTVRYGDQEIGPSGSRLPSLPILKGADTNGQ